MKLVQDLYAAFADVTKPNKLDGCRLGCCMPKEDENVLLNQPLSHSDPEILWYYIQDAMWTVGNKHDFKYYVPRLLELGLTEPEYSHGGNFISFPETFGKKLRMAGFDEWTEVQRNLIDEVIYQIMIDEARRKAFYSFSGWMCAICYINLDKKRYLDFLDSDEGSEVRDYFFVDQRKRHTNAYKYGRMKGSFWDELDVEKTNQIYEWLVSRKNQSDIALRKSRLA